MVSRVGSRVGIGEILQGSNTPIIGVDWWKEQLTGAWDILSGNQWVRNSDPKAFPNPPSLVITPTAPDLQVQTPGTSVYQVNGNTYTPEDVQANWNNYSGNSQQFFSDLASQKQNDSSNITNSLIGFGILLIGAVAVSKT